MSGCSCTNSNGNPGDGSGNTGDGNGSTVDGGAIAAGVIVVLLVAAIATGGVFVGIFVWCRRSSYFTTNRECRHVRSSCQLPRRVCTCVLTDCCSTSDVKSVMEARVHAVPMERRYDEACESKNQVLEPTAYEVPIHLKHTDMVCVYIMCMVCACVCVCVCVRVCACDVCCVYISTVGKSLLLLLPFLVSFNSDCTPFMTHSLPKEVTMHGVVCVTSSFFLCGCYLIPSASLSNLLVMSCVS